MYDYSDQWPKQNISPRLLSSFVFTNFTLNTTIVLHNTYQIIVNDKN